MMGSVQLIGRVAVDSVVKKNWGGGGSGRGRGGWWSGCRGGGRVVQEIPRYPRYAKGGMPGDIQLSR